MHARYIAVAIILMLPLLTALDLKFKLFSSILFSALITAFIVHLPLILLFNSTAQYSSGIITGLSNILIILFSLYFFCRIHFFPVFLKERESTATKTLFGGRFILYVTLVAILFQIPLYLLVFKEYQLAVRITDLMVAAILLFLMSANGFLRIMILSKRLRLSRRILLFITIWIPIVNIITLLYMGRIAWLEYDHACYKAQNLQIRAENDVCKTRYPILMLHGIFFKDIKYINYWGRIPRELQRNGATIYYGNQEACATVANNGLDIKNRIEKIVEQTGCQKVNIIAHSKGGLDARYALGTYDLDNLVASVTTIGSPHRGCRMVDFACRLPDFIYRGVANGFDAFFRKCGDKNPDFYLATRQFSTAYAAEFNQSIHDAKGVYYQSYTGVMKSLFSAPMLGISYSFIKMLEGANDGLVSVTSSKWGNFRGLMQNSRRRGISHADEVDMMREDYQGFDITEAYITIVSELKSMGY